MGFSFSRKAISAMGIEAEKIDQLVEMHMESIDGLKDKIAALEESVATYKAEAEKLPIVQKELNDLKAQVEADAKAREGKDYDKLKKEFDDYKAEISAKETKAVKEDAYRKICKDAKLSEEGIAKALKYANWDEVELDDSGEIKDSKKHLKAIEDEWGKYVETTQQQGANTSNPPANNGGSGKTREEILAMKNYSDMQKAIAENHELFGF